MSKYGAFSGLYLPVFSPNTRKYKLEKKLRIWTLFSQWKWVKSPSAQVPYCLRACVPKGLKCTSVQISCVLSKCTSASKYHASLVLKCLSASIAFKRPPWKVSKWLKAQMPLKNFSMLKHLLIILCVQVTYMPKFF